MSGDGRTAMSPSTKPVRSGNRLRVVERQPFMSALALRRTLRALLGCGTIAAIVWGGTYSYAALDHPVTRVFIDGEVDPAERAQVEAVVNRSLKGGVLSVDAQAIVEGLQALGWTRSVSVRRVWPDRIEVALAHSVPIARWNSNGLLGDDGRAFPYVGQRIPADLPNLFGPRGSAAEVVRHYGVLREIFGPAGLLVTRTGQDEKGNWSMVLDGQIAVLLGNRDVLDRARRVVDLYARHLAAERDRIARVDARYANGVAVAWHAPGGEATAPGESGSDAQLDSQQRAQQNTQQQVPQQDGAALAGIHAAEQQHMALAVAGTQ